MKTKKSKILFLLIIATMVLTINLPSVYVHADDTIQSDCLHKWVFSYREYNYYYTGAATHLTLIDSYYTCSKCNIKKSEQDTRYNQPCSRTD